eukprot:1183108-Pyramimonas_sp.AAC.1
MIKSKTNTSTDDAAGGDHTTTDGPSASGPSGHSGGGGLDHGGHDGDATDVDVDKWTTALADAMIQHEHGGADEAEDLHDSGGLDHDDNGCEAAAEARDTALLNNDAVSEAVLNKIEALGPKAPENPEEYDELFFDEALIAETKNGDSAEIIPHEPEPVECSDHAAAAPEPDEIEPFETSGAAVVVQP